MLETIRAYAWDQLAASGEAEELQRWHAQYFVSLAEEIEPLLQGAEQTIWLQQLEADYANLRVILQSSIAKTEAQYGARLAGALWRYWEVRGRWGEGRSLLASFIPASVDHDADSPSILAQAKVLHGAAALAFYQADDVLAQTYFEHSLALYRQFGDQRGTAWVLIYLGWMANDRGDFAKARSSLEESLSICHEIGDQRGIAWSLARFGLMEFWSGNLALGQEPLEESLAICRALGDRWGAAWALHPLAGITYLQGDVARGLSQAIESVTLWREVGERRNLSATLMTLAGFSAWQGDVARAHNAMREAFTIQRELGDNWGKGFGLYISVFISGAQGQMERAVRLAGAAITAKEAMRVDYPVFMLQTAQSIAEEARQVLSEETWSKAYAEGQAMTLDQAVIYALEDSWP
jgi:tetratricopeptide (TPR) repeat protein